MSNSGRPKAGTIEAWAYDLINSPDPEAKLGPLPPPDSFEFEAPLRRLAAPSRPAPLRVVSRAPKTPRAGALERPEVRARLLHLFLHHELQAAELFAWALLAFPQTPEDFRRGLLRLCLDELRHARMLRGEVQRLGAEWGDFGVRDWFWERFVGCETPLAFTALMGLGFEGGNLDHGALWARRLRAAGDEQAARTQERIVREEIEHVAFGVRWFRRFAGGLDFESWRAALPAPLTPTVLRGPSLNGEARRAAGLDDPFLEDLEAWDSAVLGS